MGFSVQYKELFRQKILHKYFLDKGIITFDAMSESDRRKQLENYHVASFFKIIPTTETLSILNGHHLVFKTTDTGFTIWAKISAENPLQTFVSLNNQLQLTFLIRIVDPFFLNYTGLDFDTADKVFFFSNIKPASYLPDFQLIDQAGGNSYADEKFSLFIKGDKINEDESGLIKRLKTIALKEKPGLFGFIHLSMSGDKETLNVTEPNGEISDPVQTFEIVFENRKSVWRYIFNAEQSINSNDDLKTENGNKRILITKASYPLTRHGFIPVKLGTKELPNPDSAILKPDPVTEKVYSEIYM